MAIVRGRNEETFETCHPVVRHNYLMLREHDPSRDMRAKLEPRVVYSRRSLSQAPVQG